MALPETGLTIKRQPEILEEIKSRQNILVDSNIANDEDTLLGQFNTIFADREASVNELAQDVYSSRALDSASGKALDDLVSILNIRRQKAVATNGEQYFTGKNGITIPQNSIISSPSTSKKYSLDTSVLITGAAARIANIDVLNTLNSTLYTVTINSVAYTYTSGGSATKSTILTGLEAAINVSPPANMTVAVVSNFLKISTTNSTDINIVIDSNLVFEDVTVAGNISGLETGAIIQTTNSVTTIDTPVTNWLSTYNPLQLTTGRGVETDQELRSRARLTTGTGKATINALIRELRNVDGVTYADVIESTYSNPVSPHPIGSINCVVVGGSNTEVAQTILDTRGGGVETSGTISQTATDSNGTIRSVKFDRPTGVPIWVDVTFDLYDDEQFPTPEADGIQAIVDAIVLYGNTIGTGNDVDAGRFFGAIYNSVSGISNLSVEVSDDGVTYGASVVIAANSVSTFTDDGKITVAKNP